MRIASLQQSLEVFDIQGSVDGTPILQNSSAQSAVHQKDFWESDFPKIDEIMNIMGKRPVPGTFSKRFFKGGVQPDIAGERPDPGIPVLDGSGRKAGSDNSYSPRQ